MRRIEMEQKAYALLDEAMARRDLNGLANAIAGCERMVPPLVHEKVNKARAMKVRQRSKELEFDICRLFIFAWWVLKFLDVIFSCGRLWSLAPMYP